MLKKTRARVVKQCEEKPRLVVEEGIMLEAFYTTKDKPWLGNSMG